MKLRVACVVAGFLSLVLSMAAQTSGSSPASAVVPPLIQFSNVATDEGDNPMSGVVSITFSLYNGQQGGEPLWTETQNNIPLDPTGHYSVQLGITKPTGVPTTLFTTGEARWLGVQISGQGEQPRVLLLSVPYALEAGDAATIGGLPPTAFVLAAPLSGSAASASATFTGVAASPADAPPAAVTGSGTTNFIPLWTSTSNIGNSVLFQSGTGSTAKVGINSTTPATTLDVKGAGTIRGTLSLPATGTATATAGKNSQPLNLVGSAFNSSTSAAVNQTFQWQAEPAGNDTSTPSGTLNLLFGEGTTKPSETGLNIASNGQITFATGQTFPGTGNGTVTRVGSGAGLTGGPITGSGTLSIATGGVSNAMLANPSLTVAAGTDLTGGGSVALGGSTTLNLDTTKVPQLEASNTFTGNQAITGNLSATGLISSTGATFASGNGVALQASSSSGTVDVATATFLLNAFTSGGGVFNVDSSGNGFYKGSVSAGGAISGSSEGGSAVYGSATGSSGVNFGVQGVTASASGVGVQGSGPGNGVSGLSSADGTGVIGVAAGSSGLNFGVQGISESSGGIGVQAENMSTDGFVALAGPQFLINSFVGSSGMFTVDTSGNGFYAGNLNVTGNLSKGGGMFKIDHPLDPANKYLSHSFVESPDMMDIYNGLVTLDAHGSAWIIMPDYFEALNRDFRYQLTSIGKPQPSLYIGKELAGNRFKISGGKPGGRVSWQVTGIRHDAYANAYRIPTEEDKPTSEQGYYLHPEVFGEPASKSIHAVSQKPSATHQLARASNP